MVTRVLAGAVPMLCGTLILSGVIPVGKWVAGSAAPNPIEMMREVSAAGALAQAEFDADDDSAPPTLSAEQVAALSPADRASYEHRLSRARIAAIRAQAERAGADPDRAGWAPSGGGWAQ